MAALSSTTTESEHVVDLLGSGPALRESPGEGLGLRPGGLWRDVGVPPGLFRVESRRATRTALDRVRPGLRRRGPGTAGCPGTRVGKNELLADSVFMS